VQDICEIFGMSADIDTKVIAASVRNPIHVTQCALAGADIVTIPYKTLKMMLHHPLTDAGIVKFRNDYRKVFGDK
jgi:transaldolase